MARPQDTSRKTPSRRGRGYRPTRREAWDRAITYLEQAERWLADPAQPFPDIHLLAGHPGLPFREIWVAPHPERPGTLVVFFLVKNPKRGPRWCPPWVFLSVRLLLAFGGSLHVNDNIGHEQGWAYLKLWSDREKTTLDRIIANPPVGVVVKQRSYEGQRTDHHSIDPDYLSFVPVERVRLEGRPAGTPRRGRPEAIATALEKYRKSHQRSDIPITEQEYAAILERVFAALDGFRRLSPVMDEGAGSGRTAQAGLTPASPAREGRAAGEVDRRGLAASPVTHPTAPATAK